MSFANVFNIAKTDADNRPPVKRHEALTAEVSTGVHKMMTAQMARQQFIRTFKETARHLHRWDVFRDFITLAASELDLARIRTPENVERSEIICAKYDSDDIQNLKRLFCLMVNALESKFHDFLGAIFMKLELGADEKGQYFTPYSVQSMMARMLFPGARKTIDREGFITVSDPASGAAGMIVAWAECLLDAGYNPSWHMFGSCIDVDPIAADMAFIQLSLLGIAAEVVTGNTLTMNLHQVRYTPVYYFNEWESRLESQIRFKTMLKFMREAV